MDQNKSEEFYARLLDQLKESTTWPSNYLYKFIVLSDPEKIDQIQKIFDNTGAVIESKKIQKGEVYERFRNCESQKSGGGNRKI